MPIFEYNGKKYNVRDEHIDQFAEKYPDATTVMENEGKKWKVKPSNYNAFVSQFQQPKEDATTVKVKDEVAKDKPIETQPIAADTISTPKEKVEVNDNTTNNNQVINVGEPPKFGPVFTTKKPQIINNAASEKLAEIAKAQRTVPAAPKVEFNLDPNIRKFEEYRTHQDANRQQVKDLAVSIDAELDRRGKELDAEAAKQPQMNIPRGTAMAIPSFNANRTTDPEYREWNAAKRALENAQNIINEADINANDGKRSSFVAGAARGFGQKFFDLNNYDLGMAELSDNAAVLKALDAAENNELSPSQQALLDAKAVELATNAYFGSYVGRGYKAGKVTAESIPFMLEMAINPAKAVGQSLASRLARYALKKFGNKEIVKNGAKYVITKAIPRVAGDIAAASGMTATTGSIRTAADAIDRMSGQIIPGANNNETVFAGRKEGDNIATAISKAFANTTIENYSEMLGEYFAPILKGADALRANTFSKIGLENVNKFFDDVAASDIAKLISDFEENAKWNGSIGEFAEEIAGGALNAAIVGDQTLDTDEQTGVFNRNNLIDTFLGVSLMGGAISTLKSVGYPIYKYKAANEIDSTKEELYYYDWGDEGIRKITSDLASSDMELVKTTLDAIFDNPSYSDGQKIAAAKYAQANVRYGGVVKAEQKRRNELEAPEQVEIEQSFDNGYTLEEPKEMNDAKNNFDYAEQQVRIALGLAEDENIEEVLNNNPRLAASLEPRIAQDYYNAKATFDGMIQKVNDDISSQMDRSDKMIQSRISQTDSMIHPATLKEDNRQVYIVAGNVSLLNDGTIDTANSDESIIVKDAVTGKAEFTDPSALQNVEAVIDPLEEQIKARQLIRESYAQEAANKIDGVLPFQPNDQYTLIDDQGAQHTATIVSDNGDNTVAFLMDNETEPTIATKEEVQQMVDAHNKARLLEFKQQQEQVDENVAEATPELPYKKGDLITVQTDDKQIRGSITNINEDGSIELHTETPIQGESNLSTLSVEELNNLAVEKNGQAIEKPAPIPAIERIPVDENGNKQFEAAPAKDSWEALVDMNDGDTAEAMDTAQQMLAIAKKDLEKATKQKAKSGNTIEEIQAIKAERKAQIAQLQSKVDYWSSVTSYPAELEKMKEVEKKINDRVKMETAIKASQSKGRYAKENADLGEPIDFTDYVMRSIATGGIKFKWSNNPTTNTKGLGAHTGLSQSNKERNSRIWMLDNTNGLYPEEAAEQLLTSYIEEIGYEPNIDTMQALSEIVDVVSSYATPNELFKAVQNRHKQRTEDLARREEESAISTAIKREQEWQEYLEMLETEILPFFETDYDNIRAIFVEVYQEQENIQNNEQNTTTEGIQREVSKTESDRNSNEGSGNILQAEQSDTAREVQTSDAEQRVDAKIDNRGSGSISESEVRGAADQIKEQGGKVEQERKPAEKTKITPKNLYSKNKSLIVEPTKPDYTTVIAPSMVTMEVPMNLYKYVSKDKLNAYSGIYFDKDKYLVATDTFNLVALKVRDMQRSDAEKFVTKSLETKAEGQFNWRDVVVSVNKTIDGTIDFVDIVSKVGKKAKKNEKKKAVRISYNGESILVPAERLQPLADFQKAVGIGDVRLAFIEANNTIPKIQISTGANFAIAVGIDPKVAPYWSVYEYEVGGELIPPTAEVTMPAPKEDITPKTEVPDVIRGDKWNATEEPTKFKSNKKRGDNFDGYIKVGKNQYGRTTSEGEELEILYEDYGNLENAWNAYERGDVFISPNLASIVKAILVDRYGDVKDTAEVDDGQQILFRSGDNVTENGDEYTIEEQQIIDNAKADGTYLKAPNGKDTNLTPKQWVQVRTKAFKEWFGDWENKSLANYLLGNDVVATLSGNEFVKDGTPLSEKVTQYYIEHYNGKVERVGLGEVLLDKRSVKDSTSHGLGKAKSAAFAAVPNIITDGRIIDSQTNWKDRGYDSVTIAAPIRIGEENYVGVVVVKKSKEFNRFYLHEVMIQKSLRDGVFQTNLNVGNPSGDIAKVIKNIINANNSSKIIDANGEPKVVYHRTPNKFTSFDVAKIGSSTDWGAFGKGFYFSPDAEQYRMYGDKTMALFLNARNPLMLDDKNAFDVKEPFFKDYSWGKDSSEAFTKWVKDNGYDAIIYNDGYKEEDIVFKPNQIKSATDNVGTFDSNNDDIRFRSAESAPVFYSNAEYAVKAVKQEKATPEQWLKMIEKNGGLKAGEDKWLGLSDWLKSSDKKTLTKQEVLDFIKENQIQIEEVEYVENPQGFEELKREYDGWLRNEGYDYAWEQLADRYGDDAEIAFADFGGELQIDNAEVAATLLGDERSINPTRLDYTTEGLENNKEIALVVPTIESWNESDDIHFGDAGEGRAIAWVRFGETTAESKESIAASEAVENYLAEMREKYGTPVGEETDAMSKSEISHLQRLTARELNSKEHGERVLVIDEVQSKRHQEGREKGYAKTEANAAFVAYRDQMMDKYGIEDIGSIYGVLNTEDKIEFDKLRTAANLEFRNSSDIPSAPFEKNWAELAMKRMLRYAAENGFDKIAWTTGEQQAERYDLRQVVEQIISADNNIEETSDGIPIVKDVALIMSRGIDYNFKVDKDGVIHNTEFRGKTLSSVVGKPLAERIMQQKELVVRGADLKIGGEGMKAFYDQMIPSFMNKYGKKWGVKVQNVTLPHLAKSSSVMHSIDVTDAMRESVMQGQPMFRITNFNSQFNDLQSEYDALDKNDEVAIRKWIDKKKALLKEYADVAIKELSLPVTNYIVTDNSNPEDVQSAFEAYVDAIWSKTNEDTISHMRPEEFAKKIENTDAVYSPGADLIIINANNIVSLEESVYAGFMHEQTHGVNHRIFSKEQMARIWEEAKELDRKRAKIVARGYKGVASRGEEYLTYYTENFIFSDQREKVEAYIKGDTTISVDEMLKNLDNSLPLRDEAIKQILEYYRNEYKRNNADRRRDQHKEGQQAIPGGESSERGGVSAENKGAGRRGRTAEERQRARALAATTLAESLGVKLNVIEDVNDITDTNSSMQRAKRDAKAWYDVATDQVYFVAPNATSVQDAEESVLHEVVAHKGLRDVVGRERFDTFLDKVYRGASEDIRLKIARLAAMNGWNFHVATEEYLASLAEQGFEDRENRTFFEKVRDLFMDMLRKAKIILGYDINNNDMRYMLWRTYQMQKSKGVMAAAEDVVMQQKLGVGNFRTRPVTEEERIIADAKADGTYLKAPNGKDTNLTPKQWAQVRTKAFKKWFGDWEKATRIEKLRKSKDAEITGNEIEASEDLKQYKKNAQIYGRTLQGEYTNADTGAVISLQRGRHNGGINEVLQHNYKDVAHLQSVAAIPQIIENGIYIESQPNRDTDTNPNVKEYQMFVCGLKIGGEDYTVLAKVAVDSKGNRYYDHNLVSIEKGKLIDIASNEQSAISSGFGTTPDTKSTTNSERKYKEFISLLQTNSSKIVDANGEPKVVYHGSVSTDITEFDKAKIRANETDAYYNGFWFSTDPGTTPAWRSANKVYQVFLNLRNPIRNKEANQIGRKFLKTDEAWELIGLNDIRSGADAVRYKLERDGYDGVIHFGKPQIDINQFNETGKTYFETSDGTKYIVLNEEDGVNVYEVDRYEEDEKGELNTSLDKIEDIFDDAYFFGDETFVVFEPNQIKLATDNVGTFDAGNNDIRFRITPTSSAPGTAREKYDKAVRTHIKGKTNVGRFENIPHQLQEGYQDSMLGLKKLQEAIETEVGSKIQSLEDAYTAENQLSSKNKAQTEAWQRDYFNPIVKEITKLTKSGVSYAEIVDYLYAKHGLERNLVFSRKEAEKNEEQWDGFVKRDYSGLTELTGEPELFTEAATQIVEEFETENNTDNLWKVINAATKSSLKKSFDGGLMSKETYENVANMFEYYIPLRGWANDAAEDFYEYIGDSNIKIIPALKTAKGRTSRADDPIATLAVQGESSIIQANRNLMKQKFLNLAINKPTNLLSVSEAWYVKQPDGTWRPEYPIIPENATGDEVDKIIKEFEAKMESYGENATKAKNNLDLKYHTTKWQGQEHAVRVMRNGKEYIVYVNGNPIAAQAVNGDTNPNANEDWLISRAQDVKNLMARAFTSSNPAFIVSNLARDVIWAGTAVAIKENSNYTSRYTQNTMSLFKNATLPRLLKKWSDNTLDPNNETERYFLEFLTNGGETGFTQLNSVDDYKRAVARFIDEANGDKWAKTKKAFSDTIDFFEFFNRSAEDTTRFAVYMTSRQMGRGITESIANAKDITVNFNKKGRGTFGAKYMNLLYIFFNAAVQSLANFGKLLKSNPKKTIAAMTAFSTAGFTAPAIALALAVLTGGDDDEQGYWDLPEWVRRNNLVLYVPFTDNHYITIPLPHEMRAFYGIGELAFSVLMGKETVEDALAKARDGFADMLPLDFTGNGGSLAINFTPTIAQPIAQVLSNTDYFGKPIYRKTPFNELDPEWTKTYKGTNPLLVDATSVLNNISGGDKVESGKIDLNPAIIEHLFEGYVGGLGKTFNKAAKTLSMLWDEDARTWSNVPIASNFYQIGDERTSGSQINREYFDAIDEMKQTEHIYQGYKREQKMGSMEYAEKLSELTNSPTFKRYKTIKKYSEIISDLNKKLKDVDKTDRDSVENAILNLKLEMLEQLEDAEKSETKQD